MENKNQINNLWIWRQAVMPYFQFSLVLLLCLPFLSNAETNNDHETPRKKENVTKEVLNKSHLIKKSSVYSVKETLDKLEALLKKKNLTVFARINHQKNAQSVNMELAEAEILIFGNPKLGTRIMKHDIEAGFELPLRVFAYADTKGKTWLTYHNPQGLKQSYALEDCKVIDKIETALDKMTTTISQ